MASTLSLSLSPDELVGQEFWIKLVQVKQEELATYEEAAALIDELFDLDPCNPKDDQSEEEQPEEEAQEEQTEEEYRSALDEAYWNKIKEQSGELCGEPDGRYVTQVRVYRSHQDRDFTLLIQGGEVISKTVGHVETITDTTTVKNASALPVKRVSGGTVKASWLGQSYSKAGPVDSPEPQLNDASFSWDGNISGTLQIEQDYPYELLTIMTDGEDCELIALFTLATDELTLEPPAEDDESEQLCSTIGGKFAGDDKENKCIKLVEHKVLCNCSGKDSGHSYTEQVEVACPDGENAGNTVGKETTVSYADCGEVEKVNDPEYYEEVCCEPPPFGLPRCKEVKSVWGGTTAIDPADFSHINGGNISVVGVGPKNPPCGVLTTKQDINNKGCCDEIDPIEIVAAETDETINYPGSAKITGKGGRPPYKWKVSGGYVFANGRNEVVTATYPPVNRIYTDSEPCSDAVVNLEDNCTRMSVRVRQTAELLEPKFPDDMVMGEDSEMLVRLVESSVGPYYWQGSGDLEWKFDKTDAPENILISQDGFCGSDTVSVEDACQNQDTQTVRSTNGVWVRQEAGTFDICQPPGSPYPNPTPDAFDPVLINGDWRVYAYQGYHGVIAGTCSVPVEPECPIGNAFFESTWPDTNCSEVSQCGHQSYFDGSCCIRDVRPIYECNLPADYQPWFAYYQKVQALYHWECV